MKYLIICFGLLVLIIRPLPIGYAQPTKEDVKIKKPSETDLKSKTTANYDTIKNYLSQNLSKKPLVITRTIYSHNKKIREIIRYRDTCLPKEVRDNYIFHQVIDTLVVAPQILMPIKKPNFFQRLFHHKKK